MYFYAFWFPKWCSKNVFVKLCVPKGSWLFKNLKYTPRQAFYAIPFWARLWTTIWSLPEHILETMVGSIFEWLDLFGAL